MAISTRDDSDLTKEISMLRAQLNELSDAWGGNASSEYRDVLRDAVRSVRETLTKYGDTAKSVAHEGARLKDKAGTALVEQTEAHPFTTMAMILGAGFLAGWLSRRH